MDPAVTLDWFRTAPVIVQAIGALLLAMSVLSVLRLRSADVAKRAADSALGMIDRLDGEVRRLSGELTEARTELGDARAELAACLRQCAKLHKLVGADG